METPRTHAPSDLQVARWATDRPALWPDASSAPPLLMTTAEVAALLRTTRKAVYAMVERRDLPVSRDSVVECSFDLTCC